MSDLPEKRESSEETINSPSELRLSCPFRVRNSPCVDGDIVFVNRNAPSIVQPKLVVHEARLGNVPIHSSDVIIAGDFYTLAVGATSEPYHVR